MAQLSKQVSVCVFSFYHSIPFPIICVLLLCVHIAHPFSFRCFLSHSWRPRAPSRTRRSHSCRHSWLPPTRFFFKSLFRCFLCCCCFDRSLVWWNEHSG